MSILRSRFSTSLITVFLLSLTFIVIGAFISTPLTELVLAYIPTVHEQLLTITALGFISIFLTKYGIRTERTSVLFSGVLFMQVTYGVVGASMFSIVDPVDPLQSLILTGVIAVGVTSMLLVYAFISSKDFIMWEVYAVLLGVSATILGVAAVYIPILWYPTIAIFLLAFMMYITHVISRFKKSVPHPVRNGSRLYIAIVGAPLELLFFIVKTIMNRAR